MKFILTALLLISAASSAAAQTRWPVSVELNGGHGLGRTNGEYRGDGAGLAMDALVAYRITSGTGAGAVAALGVGSQGAGVVTTDCLPSEAGGCVPHFPSFSSVAVLGGFETGPSSTLRGLIGPAYVRADESTVGIQGRADLALPILSRLSVALSGRTLVIPNYRGDSFQLYSVGVGFRVR